MKTKPTRRLLPLLILPLFLTGGLVQAQKPDVTTGGFAPVQKPDVTTGSFAPAQKGDPFVSGAPTPASDPFAEPVPGSALPLPTEALVKLEWVSLSPAAARTALRKYPTQAGLYQWTQEELDKEDQGVVKLERIEVMRLRAGQRARLESFQENPYATEYDPASTAGTVGLGVPVVAPQSTTTNVEVPPAPAPAPVTSSPGEGAKGEKGPAGPAPSAWAGLPADFLKTPLCPISFERQNVGWTVEMELTLSGDNRTADMNYSAEFVQKAAEIPMDKAGEVKQPVFENQRLTNKTSARVGEPTFIGTMSPPNESAVSGAKPEPRVWFHFITVNLAR